MRCRLSTLLFSAFSLGLLDSSRVSDLLLNLLLFQRNLSTRHLSRSSGPGYRAYTTLADTFHKRNLYLLEEPLFVNSGKSILNRELHVLTQFLPCGSKSGLSHAFHFQDPRSKRWAPDANGI